MLLDNFIEGEFSKVREIKNYLVKEVGNDDYAPFYPTEYWLLLYWTQDYDELLESISSFDSLKIASYRKKILPAEDLLFNKLRDKSRESADLLNICIDKASITETDKDFLSMNLAYLLSGDDYPVITQDSLNLLADNFLADYPGNNYEDFTRKYIRYRFRPGNWSFTTEFFSGYSVLTGNLSENFTNNVPVGASFDIYYKKLDLSLRYYIGIGKTSTNIPYSTGIWEDGSQANVLLPEVSLGYVIIDNKKIRITPFAGIGGTSISPPENDLNENPDLKEVALDYSTTYTFGATFDFKFGSSAISFITDNTVENDYWFLRIRYSYIMPQFESKYPGLTGNMHCITIGFGIFGQRMKRDF